MLGRSGWVLDDQQQQLLLHSAFSVNEAAGATRPAGVIRRKIV